MLNRRLHRNPLTWACAAIVIAAAGGFFYFNRAPAGNPDALWRIDSQQCVPHQQQLGHPDPCREVNLEAGYVVLKDRVGPLQFLLMPVAKISGIESPRLLDEKTPNFFYHAWQARQYMTEKAGTPVPDSAVSLAINSPSGRTQNQLHIHISCLRTDVRQQLNQEADIIGPSWQTLPVPLAGHPYLAKRISASGLAEQSPFIMLAREVPGAAAEMGHYGMAMAELPDGAFVLLAVERNLLRDNRASPEELQDHNCAILRHG
ncbi:CDP-diacylglycerol diphosphatase [Martelella alba]|uniref:CDP-diacylglycerol pyrophosphatase n=1 Tax=Martelella alba TaxID=2590451 RepID=A0ABY2SMV3_9HYPH|nr:CDP-diacylglycerol diphosphatase [Martelella alba]TKI07215.1 CDP-diacylglycerol diphosphatase [Martelella alba]